MSTIKSSAENLTLNADGANNDIKFQSNGSEVASIDQAGVVTSSKLNLTQSAGTAGTVTIGGTTNAYSAPVLLTVSDIGLDVTDGTKHLASWASHGGSSHAGSAIGTRSNHDLALITNDTKAVFIDTTGAVTMPAQPAFLVQPASDQTNIAINDDVTIVYGIERFDQNSDFASNTFTAPVTGKYQLNTSIRIEEVDTAPAYYQIKLITSNRTYAGTYAPKFASDPAYFTFPHSALADMDAGDTAHIAIHQHSAGTAQSDVNTESYFSGYLAC